MKAANTKQSRHKASLALPLTLSLTICEAALLYNNGLIPLANSVNAAPSTMGAHFETIYSTVAQPVETVASPLPAQAPVAEPCDSRADTASPSSDLSCELPQGDARIFATDRAMKVLEQYPISDDTFPRQASSSANEAASLWKACDTLASALTSGPIQPDFDMPENSFYFGLKFVVPIGRHN